MSQLSVRDLSIAFAGLKALEGVTFDVPKGSIFGLIGPNGAGKTTLLNCLSRFYQPDRGSVTFENVEVTRIPVHHVAQLGICRTFQNLELFGALTVRDNVRVGSMLRHRASLIAELLRLPAAQRAERQARDEAAAAIDVLGLTDVADTRVADLPFGVQKTVELARALVAKPRLLLLDEPAAGMNAQETARLAQTIRQLRDEMGVTVLLVEHDMRLVMGICDRIVVLDHGEVLAQGSPAEIKANERVVEAYLGREALDA
jgi:branched-chain amino acid transport system ATP-binding protein